MTRNERLAATIDGSFVVFMIGMRINNILKINKWLPVATAMPRMIKELSAQPELGFLHAEAWFGRTTIMVQYWRSMDQLLAYAHDKEAQHLPAWRTFNKAVGTDGAVGIWHETYKAGPGTYENVYVNMPAFGLGGAGDLVAAKGDLRSAARRLGEGSVSSVPRP